MTQPLQRVPQSTIKVNKNLDSKTPDAIMDASGVFWFLEEFNMFYTQKSLWRSMFRDDMCKGKFIKDYSTNHIKPFYRSKERY